MRGHWFKGGTAVQCATFAASRSFHEHGKNSLRFHMDTPCHGCSRVYYYFVSWMLCTCTFMQCNSAILCVKPLGLTMFHTSKHAVQNCDSTRFNAMQCGIEVAILSNGALSSQRSFCFCSSYERDGKLVVHTIYHDLARLNNPAFRS